MTFELEPVFVQPPRLAELVFERVSGAILDGTLRPGALVRDVDLATQLTVSRMPVREALQRLQRIGLIDMAASRYTRVVEVTPETVGDTLVFAAQQWTTVLRLVVPDLDGDRAAEIHTLIEDVQAEIDAGARAVASTRRVYRRLAALSGNRYFIELLADIDIAVEHHLLRAEDGSDVRTRVKKHLSALDAAIARGDAAGAVRIAVQLHEDATPAAA